MNQVRKGLTLELRRRGSCKTISVIGNVEDEREKDSDDAPVTRQRTITSLSIEDLLFEV